MKSVTLTNSNVLTWMVKFKFYLSDRKCSFWSDLVQKIKIVSDEGRYPYKFEYAEFDCSNHLACFRPEILFGQI